MVYSNFKVANERYQDRDIMLTPAENQRMDKYCLRFFSGEKKISLFPDFHSHCSRFFSSGEMENNLNALLTIAIHFSTAHNG